jgi:hypothetical protein
MQTRTVEVYGMVVVADVMVLGHILPSHLLLNGQRLP